MKGNLAMSAFADLTEQPFGRLKALSRGTNSTGGRVRWLCQCTCGNTCLVLARNLVEGKTTSCGCLRRELQQKRGQIFGQRRRKHGAAIHEYRMPEYLVWVQMRQRCYNTRHAKYGRYGARGITVDASWLHDFPQFLADMG